MLRLIIDFFLYSLFGLDKTAQFSIVLDYFIYDSVKIILLLFLMIFVMGILRTYIPTDKLKKLLSGKKTLFGNIIASLFGAVTPFCSCSSIPIFIGFVESGIPLGTSFSFLITSPLVNEYLVVLMFGFFGWKITVAYVLFGIMIGVICGYILGKLDLDKNLVYDIFKKRNAKMKVNSYSTLRSRISFGYSEAKSIVYKSWIWILVGVSVGAIIHNYVPQSLIQGLIGRGGIFTVPLAVLLGVPMYGSCAAIVPIAFELFQKGVPIGTGLAFMMAISGLSLPEAIILRRVMNLKLIALFFFVVAFAIVITGYLFNILQGVLI